MLLCPSVHPQYVFDSYAEEELTAEQKCRVTSLLNRAIVVERRGQKYDPPHKRHCELYCADPVKVILFPKLKPTGNAPPASEADEAVCVRVCVCPPSVWY